jgi:hypothetical protein
MITPDLWVPAYVTVDDNVGWKAIGGDGTTDVHYRGRASVSRYSHPGSFQNRLASADAAFDSGPEVIGQEKDRIVLPFGSVEQSLNTIIRKLLQMVILIFRKSHVTS